MAEFNKNINLAYSQDQGFRVRVCFRAILLCLILSCVCVCVDSGVCVWMVECVCGGVCVWWSVWGWCVWIVECEGGGQRELMVHEETRLGECTC